MPAMGSCAPAHRAAVAEPLHLHLRAAGALPLFWGGTRMGDLTSMMVYGAPGLLRTGSVTTSCSSSSLRRNLRTWRSAKLDPRVTPATRRFEAIAIENPDLAAAVADQVSLLERAGSPVDRRAQHSKHVPQKLLRQDELLRQYTVAGHQQPAREAGLDRVKTI